MDELRLEAGLGRDPAGGDRGVALLEQQLLGGVEQLGARSSSPRRRCGGASGAVATPHTLPRRRADAKQLHSSAVRVAQHGGGREERRLSDWKTIDFFTDESLVEDPYPYFDAAARRSARCCRSPTSASWRSPATTRPTEVYRDTDTFSSCNSVVGPFAAFPVPLEGDDVSDIVDQLPRPAPDARAHGHDGPARPHPRAGPAHAADHAEAPQGQRGVHVAPGRPAARRVRRRRPLRVHQRLRPALRHARRRRPARRARGGPPAVPRGLRPQRHRRRGRRRRGGQRRREPARRGSTSGSPRYIEDRRREPRKDVLTDLALGHLPRRDRPPTSPSVVRTATFLFAAGQETTARLLAAALKHLAEHPELQDELRADRDRIPDFLEEVLRIESPVKADFRLARRSTTDRRRRHRRRHAGDAAQRRRQPRPPAVRVPRRVPHRPAQRPAPTSPSAGAPTPAPAARWPGPRAGSASSASSTGCATSACPRSTTARPATAASATSRRGSCAASPSCTSSSRRSRRRE